jgi:signal transduction histidine kinase
MDRLKHIVFTPFSALSFVCIVALALGMGYALSSLLTRAVSEWEWQNTAALVRREVRMAGLETVFTEPGDMEPRERWGRQFSSILTSLPEVVRAKVWNRDAEILWSDEKHLIGQRFPGNEELQRALAGEIEVEIKHLAKSEQRYEQRKFGTLAEVYVPILTQDGDHVLGVVEVYKTPDRLMAAIERGRTMIWTISLAGGTTLYLILLPVFTRVYRRQVEGETLKAHAARLEAEVDQRTQQLHQAQKMQAIGLLAGGVAHDFNNLLTVIIGRCQLFLAGHKPDEPAYPEFYLIESAAQRAASLTRQLLAFSRKQVLQRQVLDVNAIVADLGKMLRRMIGENITLVSVLAPNLDRVNADRAQLEQIILNLVVNARDAMPQRGRLTVETSNVDLEAGAGGDGRCPPPGRYVMLAVRDTGIGMDADTQARVFEPFFTTKEPGQGTGLGLSTVYGIVQQHEGHVVVRSAPGEGSSFEIYIPRVDAALSTAEVSPDLEPPKGSETILVAEDEGDLRSLIGEVLRERGYTVLMAADGEAALRAAERWPSPIDLLLTDVVMPHLSGWELAERLTSARPETRVLYLTGYADIPGVADRPILKKPFTPFTLVRAVHEALTAPVRGGSVGVGT